MNKYINVLPKVRIYETYDIYGEICRVLVFHQHFVDQDKKSFVIYLMPYPLIQRLFI